MKQNLLTNIIFIILFGFITDRQRKLNLIKKKKLCNNCPCRITVSPGIIYRGNQKLEKDGIVVNASLKVNNGNASVIRTPNHNLSTFLEKFYSNIQGKLICAIVCFGTHISLESAKDLSSDVFLKSLKLINFTYSGEVCDFFTKCLVQYCWVDVLYVTY